MEAEAVAATAVEEGEEGGEVVEARPSTEEGSGRVPLPPPPLAPLGRIIGDLSYLCQYLEGHVHSRLGNRAGGGSDQGDK